MNKFEICPLKKKKNDMALNSFELALGAVIVCLSAVSYHGCYNGGFLFDDSAAVGENQDIFPNTSVWQLWIHDFWGKDVFHNASHKSYRPLTTLSYRWNYYYGGGLNEVSFHVVNIVLHVITCLLLYNVLYSTLIPPNLHYETHTLDNTSVTAVAATAAVLFAVHPVHTEAVCGIVGRAEMLCAIFALLALWLYQRACVHTSKHSANSVTCTKIFCMCLSAVAAMFSVLCKEQGATIIGVCSAYDILLCPSPKSYPDSFCRQVVNDIESRRPLWQRLIPVWRREYMFYIRHIVLFLTGLVILALRWYIMAGQLPKFEVQDNPHSFLEPRFIRLLNYFYIYSLNLWLCLCPWWLCCDWSGTSIPPILQLSDYRTLFAVLLVIGLAAAIIPPLLATSDPQLQLTPWAQTEQVIDHSQYTTEESEEEIMTPRHVQDVNAMISQAKQPRVVDLWVQRLVLFSLSLVILPFIPCTNLLFRVGFVIAERVLYLPTMGTCLLLALTTVHTRLCLRPVARVMVLAVIVAFTLRCAQRSPQWHNKIDLFNSATLVCVNNEKVHFNLGNGLTDAKESEKAIQAYKNTLIINPTSHTVLNNYGNLVKNLGHFEEGEALFIRAIESKPDYGGAWLNLGNTRARLGKYELAEYSFYMALRYMNDCDECYYDIGRFYVFIGRPQDAISPLLTSTEMNPSRGPAWEQLLTALSKTGKDKQVLKYGQTALAHHPYSVELHNTVAISYHNLKQYSEAEPHCRTALTIDPNNPKSHKILASVLHFLKKYVEAKHHYQQVLRVTPDDEFSLRNFKMLDDYGY